MASSGLTVHGGANIYDEYDFSEPWNGPNNKKLAELAMRVFNCPSDSKPPSSMTNYVVMVGPNTMFPGPTSIRKEDITDGPERTLILVEVANSGINWLEPRDLRIDQLNRMGDQSVFSKHKDGFCAAFADWRVLFLPDDMAPSTIKAFSTVNGDEDVDHPSDIHNR